MDQASASVVDAQQARTSCRHDGCRIGYDACAAGIPRPVRWRRRADTDSVGSIADVTFVASRSTSVEEVNGIFVEEAATKRYVGLLGVSSDALVSSDIIGDPRALRSSTSS